MTKLTKLTNLKTHINYYSNYQLNDHHHNHIKSHKDKPSSSKIYLPEY